MTEQHHSPDPAGATPAGATPAGATPAGATPAGATPAGAAGVDPDISTRDSAAPAPTGRDPLRSSTAGRAWTGLVALAIVLILLIIFIAQNTRTVTVSFLGWNGHAPLAVALLIATVAGLFVAAVAGTLRIWQLRSRVRRDQRRATRA
ncbi:hypothetical protein JCM18899A_50460 [Nocardioides sp. AN3]